MQAAWYQPGGLLWALSGFQHIDAASAAMSFDKTCLKQGFGL